MKGKVPSDIDVYGTQLSINLPYILKELNSQGEISSITKSPKINYEDTTEDLFDIQSLNRKKKARKSRKVERDIQELDIISLLI